MKPSKTSKQWMREHVNDPYVQLAQKSGYRSRAAYKLLEIDERDHLLKPGMVIVDLGATPGGWSQVAAAKVGAGGKVLALDLLPLDPLAGVTFIQGDFREESVLNQLTELVGDRPVDVVISDMAPNLSGIDVSDSARVEHLIELAIDFAQNHMKPDGALVCKVFHGSGYSQLVEMFRQAFRVVKPIKPKASRDKSAETFLVGIGLKNR